MPDAPTGGDAAPTSASAMLGEPATPTDAPAPAPSGDAPPAPKTSTHDSGNQDFYQSITDEDLRAFAQGKHLDSTDKVLRSYKELESLKGVPPERLVRLPEDISTIEGIQDALGKLGLPEDPDGYDVLEGDDNKPMRELFHKAKITSAQAKLLAEGYDAHVQQLTEHQQKQAEQQSQLDLENLKREWGAAYDYNLSAARGIARKLELDVDTMASMEGALGTDKFMKLMATMGKMVGEGRAPDANGKDGNGFGAPLTPAQARAKRDALLGDPEFQQRLMSSDARVRQAAMEERSRLSQLAYDMEA